MSELNNKKFSFTKENLKIAEAEIKKYPEGRGGSAIISLLWIAQKQNQGWLSPEVVDYIAEYLDISHIRVMEIATFYTMFNLKPVGKYHLQMCGTTPCMLSGSN
jgi:NADH-quinone oxidoreductase subunit E